VTRGARRERNGGWRWEGGALYDSFSYYGPAFTAGALFNRGNLAIVGFLVQRQIRGRLRLEPSPA
jgi:hypothetical protein